MNVLITGGCGFLGSNIASSFLVEGCRVTIVDKMLKPGARNNHEWLKGIAKQEKDLVTVEIDISDFNALEKVFSMRGPFDYVCHLAGQVAMTTSLVSPLLDFRTNTLGTVNLLENVRRNSPSAFFAFSSTNKVYGDLQHLDYLELEKRYVLKGFSNGIDESMQLDFASPYGCSKGSADQYVRDWYRTFGIATVVFRHSSIFGGRQYATVDQGWIGWFVKNALQQNAIRRQGRGDVEPFTISGTGKQVRDVLHSEDLISLYRLAYEKRGECAGEVFNIGGGMENSMSLLELFDHLTRLLDMREGLVYSHAPRRLSDQDFFVADINKVQRILGWRPKIAAVEGLSLMLDWVESCFDLH